MSEIILCPLCLVECDCNYSYKDEAEIVSQTRCKCPRQSEKEVLKNALDQLAIKFGLKSTEVRNEKSKSSSRKISR